VLFPLKDSERNQKDSEPFPGFGTFRYRDEIDVCVHPTINGNVTEMILFEIDLNGSGWVDHLYI
jgi:hypothetical protein